MKKTAEDEARNEAKRVFRFIQENCITCHDDKCVEIGVKIIEEALLSKEKETVLKCLEFAEKPTYDEYYDLSIAEKIRTHFGIKD